jgi:hypothetical protein
MLLMIIVLSVRMKLSMTSQSIVTTLMGFIILMSALGITNVDVQANSNKSFAESGTNCQDRLLIYIPSAHQDLSEEQCFYFNSCMNLGGTILGCYESARNINCDIENGKRYHCPGVVMSE